MKNIILIIAMFLSLNASAAVHNYWIEKSFCDGDACILELANNSEHFVVMTDVDLPDMNQISAEELDSMDASLDLKSLKPVSSEERKIAQKIIGKKLQVFRIDVDALSILNIQDDQDN